MTRPKGVEGYCVPNRSYVAAVGCESDVFPCRGGSIMTRPEKRGCFDSSFKW